MVAALLLFALIAILRLARGDAIRFDGDSVSYRVAWLGDPSLPEGQHIQLRFWMRNADLYSFAFVGIRS
jgi:hypothetical protein